VVDSHHLYCELSLVDMNMREAMLNVVGEPVASHAWSR
jgi:hypothetical protein